MAKVNKVMPLPFAEASNSQFHTTPLKLVSPDEKESKSYQPKKQNLHTISNLSGMVDADILTATEMGKSPRQELDMHHESSSSGLADEGIVTPLQPGAEPGQVQDRERLRWDGSPAPPTDSQSAGEAEKVEGIGKVISPAKKLKRSVKKRISKVKMLGNHAVLRPDGSFRKVWDGVQSILLIYVALVTPYRVCFSVAAEGGDYIFELLVDIYFTVDILVNFFTAYLDTANGVMVLDRWRIAHEYLTSWFVIDVASCLPIDLVTKITTGQFVCTIHRNCEDLEKDVGTFQLLRIFKVLRLMKMMKLLRLVRANRIFSKIESNYSDITWFIGIFKQVVYLVFLGHIFGCLFYYFSTEEFRTQQEKESIKSNELTPWIDSLFPIPAMASPFNRYLASVYWSFTTMTTVGYGDISAVTTAERVFATFSMIVGGFCFSGIIGAVSSMVGSKTKAAQLQEFKMEIASKYLREHKCPKELRLQIIQFMRNYKPDLNASSSSTSPKQILFEIPFVLRSKLMFHVYEELIDAGFFCHCDNIVTTEICSRLSSVQYCQAAVIYQNGQIGDCMYIVQVGKLQVMDPDLKMIIKIMGPGSFVGEGSVLKTNNPREENVVARTQLELCKLDIQDFQTLAEAYPEFKKRMAEIHAKRKKAYKQVLKGRKQAPNYVVSKDEYSRNVDNIQVRLRKMMLTSCTSSKILLSATRAGQGDLQQEDSGQLDDDDALDAEEVYDQGKIPNYGVVDHGGEDFPAEVEQDVPTKESRPSAADILSGMSRDIRSVTPEPEAEPSIEADLNPSSNQVDGKTREAVKDLDSRVTILEERLENMHKEFKNNFDTIITLLRVDH